MKFKIDWKHLFRTNSRTLPTLLVLLALTVYVFSLDRGYLDKPDLFVKQVIDFHRDFIDNLFNE